MNELLLPLLVLAGLLIAYDTAQKMLLYRLLQKANDKEREAILAMLTRRR